MTSLSGKQVHQVLALHLFQQRLSALGSDMASEVQVRLMRPLGNHAQSLYTARGGAERTVPPPAVLALPAAVAPSALPARPARAEELQDGPVPLALTMPAFRGAEVARPAACEAVSAPSLVVSAQRDPVRHRARCALFLQCGCH